MFVLLVIDLTVFFFIVYVGERKPTILTNKKREITNFILNSSQQTLILYRIILYLTFPFILFNNLNECYLNI